MYYVLEHSTNKFVYRAKSYQKTKLVALALERAAKLSKVDTVYTVESSTIQIKG